MIQEIWVVFFFSGWAFFFVNSLPVLFFSSFFGMTTKSDSLYDREIVRMMTTNERPNDDKRWKDSQHAVGREPMGQLTE